MAGRELKRGQPEATLQTKMAEKTERGKKTKMAERGKMAMPPQSPCQEWQGVN